MSTVISRLDRIALDIVACKRCPLHRTRTMTVPGDGPENSPVMLIGEGPGAVEDMTGKPFVGPAGGLLTALLAEAGIPREKVFITNALKCRAHDNGTDRQPTLDEINACRPFLFRQIRTINPRIILLLGSTAIRSILPLLDFTISSLRRKVRMIGGRWVIVTYHPSAELHSKTGRIRQAILDDLWLLRDVIDVEWGTRTWPWSDDALVALFGDNDPHLPSTDAAGPDAVPPGDARVVWNVQGLRNEFTSPDVVRELMVRFIKTAVSPRMTVAGIWGIKDDVVSTTVIFDDFPVATSGEDSDTTSDSTT